jgi:hypothetical protein
MENEVFLNEEMEMFHLMFESSAHKSYCYV